MKGPLMQYVDPPAGSSRLKRGGTRCDCSEEKDRRAVHCRECWAIHRKDLVLARATSILSRLVAGESIKTIASSEGLSIQHAYRLIKKVRGE